jgi:hypothetical protein
MTGRKHSPEHQAAINLKRTARRDLKDASLLLLDPNLSRQILKTAAMLEKTTITTQSQMKQIRMHHLASLAETTKIDLSQALRLAMHRTLTMMTMMETLHQPQPSPLASTRTTTAMTDQNQSLVIPAILRVLEKATDTALAPAAAKTSRSTPTTTSTTRLRLERQAQKRSLLKS